MKLGLFSVLASLVLGSAAILGSAFTNEADATQTERAAVESSPLQPSKLIQLNGLDPLAPETDVLIERLLSSSSEFVSFAITPEPSNAAADDDADEGGDAVAVKCGDGVGVVTPANGMSGQGWGATSTEALLNAFDDCNDKLWAFSKVKCPVCPIPGQCAPFISVLAGYKITSLTQTSDGTWHAIITVSGAYIAGCTPCPI